MIIKSGRRFSVLISLLIFAGLSLSACVTVKIEYDNSNKGVAQTVNTGTVKVEEDQLYGNVVVDMDIEEFNALGFNYGDSVDVIFSNGYKLEDIPYYTGYYVPAKDMLVVAYPGNEKILVAQNYGTLWDEFKLSSDDTVEISLVCPGKYYDVQKTLGKQYKNDREAFGSDEEFANYRNVKTKKMRDHILYRSASPCDNKFNRASYTDDLIEKDKIKTILDLSDGEEDIENLMDDSNFASPYFGSLYEKGSVIPVKLIADYTSDEFKKRLSGAFCSMIASDGPYLVNCLEGKDRTGFVIALLEALTGASYDEMVTDYMISYRNYFGLDRQSDPEAYELIKSCNFDPMFMYIAGVDNMADAKTANLESGAEKYLLSCGMTKEEVRLLKEKLTQDGTSH